jgi:TRAP-type C4-dicarboxylate transport system permease small subunit
MKRALDALALGAGWALVALAGLVGFEVLARKFFAYSLKGVDEIGGYALAAASAAGFIYALALGGHIRVDIALKHLRPRARAVLHLAAYVTLAAFAGLLVWRTAAVWMRSASLDAVAPTPLGTPLVLPQGVWLFGLAIFALFAFLLVWEVCRTFVRQGAGEVDRRFYADRLQEELEAERRDAQRRGVRSELR